MPLDSRTSTNGFPRSTQSSWRPDLDPAKDWLPIAPAAHYLCGGVVTDLDGASDLPGLWAAGEVACSGRARRQPSGVELVARRDGVRVPCRWRHRTGEGRGRADRRDAVGDRWRVSRRSHRGSTGPQRRHGDRRDPGSASRARKPRSGSHCNSRWRTTRGCCERRRASTSHDQSVVANAVRVDQAAPPEADYAEVRNLLTVADAMIRAALVREESRGAHTARRLPRARWRALSSSGSSRATRPMRAVAPWPTPFDPPRFAVVEAVERALGRGSHAPRWHHLGAAATDARSHGAVRGPRAPACSPGGRAPPRRSARSTWRSRWRGRPTTAIGVGAGAGLRWGVRAAGVDPHGRAHRAQLPRPPLGGRHAHPPLRRCRGRRRGFGHASLGHPQDHPRPARRSRRLRFGRRWREPPRQPLGLGAAQGQPPRAGGHHCGGARRQATLAGPHRARRVRPWGAGARGRRGRRRRAAARQHVARRDPHVHGGGSRRPRPRTTDARRCSKRRAASRSRPSRSYAETGVDCISTGQITNSAPVLDIGLDIGPADGWGRPPCCSPSMPGTPRPSSGSTSSTTSRPGGRSPSRGRLLDHWRVATAGRPHQRRDGGAAAGVPVVPWLLARRHRRHRRVVGRAARDREPCAISPTRYLDFDPIVIEPGVRTGHLDPLREPQGGRRRPHRQRGRRVRPLRRPDDRRRLRHRHDLRRGVGERRVSRRRHRARHRDQHGRARRAGRPPCAPSSWSSRGACSARARSSRSSPARSTASPRRSTGCATASKPSWASARSCRPAAWPISSRRTPQRIQHTEPWLTLHGLRLVHEKNL